MAVYIYIFLRFQDFYQILKIHDRLLLSITSILVSRVNTLSFREQKLERLAIIIGIVSFPEVGCERGGKEILLSFSSLSFSSFLLSLMSSTQFCRIFSMTDKNRRRLLPRKLARNWEAERLLLRSPF